MKGKEDEIEKGTLTEQDFGKRFRKTALADLPPAVRNLRAASRGKTRVTMYLDNDVLTRFREMAEAGNVGYQTLINHALRETVTGDPNAQNTEDLKSELLSDKQFIRRLKSVLAA